MARREGAARQVRRGRRAQSEDGSGLRDGVVAGLRPEQDRVVDRVREHPQLAERLPRLGLAVVQPRHVGPLRTGLDVQDRHRLGSPRVREVHTDLELLRPRLLHRVRRAGAQRTRPERPRAVRERRPDPGLHPLDQRGLLRPRDQARRKDDPRQGEGLRLLLVAADRAAAVRGGAERTVQLQAAQADREPRRPRPGPHGVRTGQAARDAAADGARRGRRREQRHDHEAAPRQPRDQLERAHDRQGAPRGLEARDQAGDGKGDQRDDAGRRPVRNGHVRPDLRREGGRQDRNGRDERAERLHGLVHLLRTCRRSTGRGRGRGGASAERLRRSDRRPDRKSSSCRRSWPRRRSTKAGIV